MKYFVYTYQTPGSTFVGTFDNRPMAEKMAVNCLRRATDDKMTAQVIRKDGRTIAWYDAAEVTEPDVAEAEFVDLQYMAVEVGLPVATLRTYHKRSRQHRRLDQTTPMDIPEPDAPIQSQARPLWRKTTADNWIALKKAKKAS